MSLLDRFWREPVLRTVLPNGLTVIVKCDPSAALASVQTWVKTGSIHEGDRLGAGLSHYLEHMLFKGTERRAGREISATVQANGGYINAYTTFDRTVYYIDLPSEHTAVALDLLADAVLRSTLPAAEVAKEKEVILREIAMTRDDPDDRLWQAVFATAFREHPYRYPIIGHEELFQRTERDDLMRYYRGRYVPNNLVVVVVGDVDPVATVAAVQEHFGKVPRGNLAPVLVAEEPGQLGRREVELQEDVEISRAAVSWQVPGLTHPDAPLLDLLGMVLGHGDSSVLWQELREKRALVHTIDASCWNPGTVGLFCVSLTADPEKRVAAEAALDKVLQQLAAKGFTPAQLKQAVRQLIAGEVGSRQTMSGQAAKLGGAEVVAGDLKFNQYYFERVERVTPADLKRVLREYLRPSLCTAVSSNPLPKPGAAGQQTSDAAQSGGRESASAPAQQGKKSSTLSQGSAARKGKKSHGSNAGASSDFAEIRLKSGARIVYQREPRLPQVHLRLVWQGGPAFEEPSKRGSTALLSTLLSKDTKQKSAEAIARFIESVGGSFYPFCGNNSFGLAVEVLPPDWKRAITVLSQASLQPAFKAQTVALERDAQLAALRQDADDVVTESRKLLRRKFFGDHPMAIDAHGELSSVGALKPADLAALHRQLNVGANVVLAVAGDFDPDELLPAAKAMMAAFSSGTAPKPASRKLRLKQQQLTEIREKEQAVVLRAYPGAPIHTSDHYVSEVADELFSGMASRLFERVREEKSLAYFVRSSRVTGLDAAMFSFIAGTKPGREDEVLAEIDAELERVRSGKVEEAELRRCHSRLKAARRQAMQTNASRALHASLNTLQGQPLNDWKNYDQRIEAVGRADLAGFAQRYLASESCTQLIVSPA